MKQHANSNVETVSAVVAFNPKTGVSAADVDVVTVTFGDMPDADIERAIDSGKGDVRETSHSVASCTCSLLCLRYAPRAYRSCGAPVRCAWSMRLWHRTFAR